MVTLRRTAHPRDDLAPLGLDYPLRFGDEPRREHLRQDDQIGIGLRDETFGTAEIVGDSLPPHRELTQGDFHVYLFG